MIQKKKKKNVRYNINNRLHSPSVRKPFCICFFCFWSLAQHLQLKRSAGKICNETSRNRDVGKYNKYYLLRCVRVQQVVVFVTETNGDEWSCTIWSSRCTTGIILGQRSVCVRYLYKIYIFTEMYENDK